MSRRPSAYAVVKIETMSFRIPVYANDVPATVYALSRWRLAQRFFGRRALLLSVKAEAWDQAWETVSYRADVETARGEICPMWWTEQKEDVDLNLQRIEAAIERANKGAR